MRGQAANSASGICVRHCEEHLRRSNPLLLWGDGLLRFARNDGLSGLDPDRLDVEIFFQMLLAGLAAITAHLVAAERHRRVHCLIAIDPDRTGAQRLGDAMRLADVPGPDAAAQAEGGG